jgi:hypothetical protein
VFSAEHNWRKPGCSGAGFQQFTTVQNSARTGPRLMPAGVLVLQTRDAASRRTDAPERAFNAVHGAEGAMLAFCWHSVVLDGT